MNNQNFIIFTGIVIGLIALTLVEFGNPSNMGFCAACFVRDISGGLGFQTNAVVQYIRPEIIGLGLGAFIIAVFTKSFKPIGSSSPMLRFVLATFVMIGALVFLGCPTRMVLRLGGGDLNAIVGLFGFIFGLYIGFKFKESGFNLGEETKISKSEGMVYPLLNVALLILLITAPSFIYFSVTGPGAMRAPIILSLSLSLIVGALSYKSEFCFSSAIAKAIFKKEFMHFFGILALLITVLIGNIVLGNFKLSFISQPIAHTDGVFNFLGMLIVGWGSVMLRGCPFRQLVKAGGGNGNSGIVILGFLIGAAIAHNFSLAATPKGLGINGQVAVIIILVLMLLISFFGKRK
ncbi:MAG: YedE family putative selenium transporter [Shewanella sp.]